jgi:N-acetylglucosaminyl-diphospho-decaprenol L-rhamnosyltransferase
VVLSYDRPHLLEQALASIQRQSHPALDVTVVDNWSPSSGRVADIARAAGVRLVANDRNLGFTGGMNRGIAQASGPYVLLTEDDMVLEPRCVEALLAYQLGHPEAGLLSGLMLNLGEGTIRCAGGEVRLGPTFEMKVHGAGEPQEAAPAEPQEVTFIPGALVFARLELLRTLGGFRDEFFMYLEDVELCARTLAAGYRVVLVPAARAHHHAPPPHPPSPEVQRHKLKNLFALYLLHAPPGALPGFFARYAAAGLVRAAMRGASELGLLSQALGWNARRLPALWRDRRERRRAHVERPDPG